MYRLYHNQYWPREASVAASSIPVAGMFLDTWYFTRAACVRDPKYVVSFPGDPGPVEAMANPWAFKYLCSLCTCSPLLPRETTGGIGALGTATGDAVPPNNSCSTSAFTCAFVAGPKYPFGAVKPEGVRISALYVSWNAATAACVFGPKYPVAESACRYPFRTRNSCNVFTSAAFEPYPNVPAKNPETCRKGPRSHHWIKWL